MTFDPKRYMMKLQGKDYLPVAPRLYWFRQEHPDWAILTTETYADEENQVYRVECVIKDAEGKPLAMGRGRETVKGFSSGPYEKAETIAIGRALSALGYGTMESMDYGEDDDGKVADSPQGRGAQPPKQGSGGQQGKINKTGDERRDLFDEIKSDWIERQRTAQGFGLNSVRWNSILHASTQGIIATPAPTESANPGAAIGEWVKTADIKDVRNYRDYNKAKIGSAELEAA